MPRSLTHSSHGMTRGIVERWDVSRRDCWRWRALRSVSDMGQLPPSDRIAAETLRLVHRCERMPLLTVEHTGNRRERSRTRSRQLRAIPSRPDRDHVAHVATLDQRAEVTIPGRDRVLYRALVF